jgi:hypothetical protein
MIVNKGIPRDTIEQGFGEIIEIHPGCVASVFHNNVNIVIPMTGAEPRKILPEKLAEQLLVISGLGGQSDTPDFQRAILG